MMIHVMEMGLGVKCYKDYGVGALALFKDLILDGFWLETLVEGACIF